jgi:hypothetical protein
MNSFKIIGILFLLFFIPSLMQGQVLKNNGAPVFLKEGTKVFVNGSGENAGGTIVIETNSELRINGNFALAADTVRFENSSTGVVAGNMTISSQSVFYRHLGALSVFGAIINSGIFYNLGGLVEIGQP